MKSDVALASKRPLAERGALGRVARQRVARTAHAEWMPAPDRTDPVALLEEQAADRVSELVPLRYGRMAASPFGFFRGAAAVMAADLARIPSTGLVAQLCGDAHLANFGGFASPERDLVFDVNDFDETLPGPWEWDVKRLTASLEIAARERAVPAAQRRDLLLAAAHEYRTAMAGFAEMSRLDVWYARVNADDIRIRFAPLVGRRQVKAFDAAAAAARRRDSVLAYRKLTRHVDGPLRLVSQPPLLVTVDDLLPDADRRLLERAILKLITAYRGSLLPDRRHLMSGYRCVDIARKVVGVGSVGTRTWVALFLGDTDTDPLFLQIKEAQESVHERFLGTAAQRNHGRRVVEGQRLMQATSDIFLGWFRSTEPFDGDVRDFYVRQLWDWKVSADITSFRASDLSMYGTACAWVLARAHARSGDRAAIAAYLGSSEAFDVALATFAQRYADQNERDHQVLVDAMR
ncbi:MAG: DUF2252 domain-containing protein, partial [Candidatus Dormibacteraeota bacterium]|nr:DUF2252 domain-containing protein [Candidatus Dormibacteraeota bacterium]